MTKEKHKKLYGSFRRAIRECDFLTYDLLTKEYHFLFTEQLTAWRHSSYFRSQASEIQSPKLRDAYSPHWNGRLNGPSWRTR
jgi:hypothetical protein